MAWRPRFSSSLNSGPLEGDLHKPFAAHFGPIGYTSQNVFVRKLWILVEHLFHRHAGDEQVQDQRHPDPMSRDAGFAEANIRISIDPLQQFVALRYSLPLRGFVYSKPLYLQASGADLVPSSYRDDPGSDTEKALRYNRGGPVLGRGQVARHRVLVPGSQVRILPPQPRSTPVDDR